MINDGPLCEETGLVPSVVWACAQQAHLQQTAKRAKVTSGQMRIHPNTTSHYLIRTPTRVFLTPGQCTEICR